MKVLIITGRNSYEHDWRGTTAALRKLMEDSGRFEVKVDEEFTGAGSETLAPYDLVVINYMGRRNYGDSAEVRWGARAEKALFDFARSGKGVVIYHASFNLGAPSWPAFEAMAGGTMRNPPPGGSRRSPPPAFWLTVQDRMHPITFGLRKYFMAMNDDMYSNMHWDPSVKVHVLVTAKDDPASYDYPHAGPKFPKQNFTPEKIATYSGIGQDQPQVWAVDYGKGRIFCIPLGHSPETISFPGFRSLFLRGAEWAASGKVTLPVADEVRAFQGDE